MVELSDQEVRRYSRQICLPEFDYDGQVALSVSHALIIGTGGLGNACALYLAASGVGEITLVDFDHIEANNLQRQILFQDEDIGQLKAVVAARKLQAQNPGIRVHAVVDKPTEQWLTAAAQQATVVVDCTDNLDTRELLNTVCLSIKKPLVSGAAIRFEGQVSVFTYQPNEPCYRCLSSQFGQQSLSCMDNGILSPVVGLVGSIQAIEVLKICAGIGQCLTSRLLLIDALSMEFRELALNPNPQCHLCDH